MRDPQTIWCNQSGWPQTVERGYREPKADTIKSVYPAQQINWDSDKAALPLLIAQGPYPQGPNDELLTTPDELIDLTLFPSSPKLKRTVKVYVPGRPWQWWERIFDLLIPHATQIAKKYYSGLSPRAGRKEKKKYF